MTSKISKKQELNMTKKVKVEGKDGRLEIKLTYDDRYGNGHNTFHITGELYEHPTSKLDEHCISGGSIGHIIGKYVPRLKHLDRWHGFFPEDKPHYLGNVAFFMEDRTHMGKEIGEAVTWKTRFKFKDVPFTFDEHARGFWEYLDGIDNFDNIKVVPIAHEKEKDGYSFRDRYSFSGFKIEGKDPLWYRTPFSDIESAKEFLEALRKYEFEYIKVSTNWCKAQEVKLESARVSAYWPDATAEQLLDEELLIERHPSLLEEFRKDMEDLGFTY